MPVLVLLDAVRLDLEYETDALHLSVMGRFDEWCCLAHAHCGALIVVEICRFHAHVRLAEVGACSRIQLRISHCRIILGWLPVSRNDWKMGGKSRSLSRSSREAGNQRGRMGFALRNWRL